jgi:beta-xylosidase
MTKRAGVYYLQYAAPGTEWRTYADGVYTATSPRGPFTYAPSSPFSHKPTGFITGAGHGATFADKLGRYWHIATMRISIKHDFERRLGIFPVEFDADGVMRANTLFGDYPVGAVRAKKMAASSRAGCRLYRKNSSVLQPRRSFPGSRLTKISGPTGGPDADAGQWLSVDLKDLPSEAYR